MTSIRIPSLCRGAASLILPAIALLSLTGCFLPSKRRLPTPVAPSIVQTASADELVAQLNDKWAKFESMTATVEILASHLKTKEGVATDYPTVRSNFLLRKPEMLRVLIKAPIVQTTIFQLASNGTSFTVLSPTQSTAYQGMNDSKGKSPNWYENLRPGFLFDAMVVRGLSQDELYSVTSEDITEEDAADKHLLLRPEYELSIVRRKADSQELFPVRIVRFHREDLLPYEQDLYDEKGSLETRVIYGAYQNYDGFQYPSTITLKRPQEEYQLVMSVERVSYNPTLTDDQFQLKIPDGYTVKQMK
jgi:outer membrane lipoprotein-sorting protein